MKRVTRMFLLLIMIFLLGSTKVSAQVAEDVKYSSLPEGQVVNELADKEVEVNICQNARKTSMIAQIMLNSESVDGMSISMECYDNGSLVFYHEEFYAYIAAYDKIYYEFPYEYYTMDSFCLTIEPVDADMAYNLQERTTDFELSSRLSDLETTMTYSKGADQGTIQVKNTGSKALWVKNKVLVSQMTGEVADVLEYVDCVQPGSTVNHNVYVFDEKGEWISIGGLEMVYTAIIDPPSEAIYEDGEDVSQYSNLLDFDLNDGIGPYTIIKSHDETITIPSEKERNYVVRYVSGMDECEVDDTVVTADFLYWTSNYDGTGTKFYAEQKYSQNIDLYVYAQYAKGKLTKDNLRNPVRDGYIFVGWYKDESCYLKASEGDEISHNTVLYAKWQKDDSKDPDNSKPSTPDPSETNPYVLKNLYYSFYNNEDAFGYPDNYHIPLSSFEMFFPKEQAKLLYAEFSLFGGNCFGMSSGTLLLNTEDKSKVSPESFDKKKVFELRPSDYSYELGYDVTHFIESVQVLQLREEVQENYRNSTRYINTYMLNMINDIRNNVAVPYVIGVFDGNIGHSFVPYAVEEINEMEDHLMVMDPNYKNELRYITLYKNKTTGQYTGWYYAINDFYECGSAFPNTTINWTRFDVINAIWVNRNKNMKTSLISVDRIAAFTVLDESGQVIADIKDGKVISYSEDVIPITYNGVNVEGDNLLFYLPSEGIYTMRSENNNNALELNIVGASNRTQVSASSIDKGALFEISLDGDAAKAVKPDPSGVGNYMVSFFRDGKLVSSKSSMDESSSEIATEDNTSGNGGQSVGNLSGKKSVIKANVKNGKSYKRSKKVTINAVAGIKAVKLNGHKLKKAVGKKKYSFKLSKYKKYLKGRKKWNKLVATDRNGRKVTVKFRVK
ncbi:MAG: InlB B-repeat-containing protein [Lachnospiraceae bacterium]|nr:InlB B-repeat-containing protein [Lachnospiraceae bacterium]